MDRLTGLTIFAKVVELGGFSAAATQMGLSPSAVSKQIAQLEDRLGARLLNRTTRRISLTDAGSGFYERVRSVLAELEDAERTVLDSAEQPRGLLRVNMPQVFGAYHVEPFLPEFLAKHPEVTLEAISEDRFVNLVEEAIDVAVRVADLNDSSLIARRLAPNKRVVVASPAYLAAHGTPHRPEDLVGHNCLSKHDQLPREEWRFERDGETVTVPIRGTLKANSLSMLKAAAVGGRGIIRVSVYTLVEELRSGQLVRLLQPFEAKDPDVYAVYAASRHLSPKVRAFVDHLVQTIGKPSYWREVGLEAFDAPSA